MKDLSIDLSNAPPRSIGALRLGIGAASRMQDFYQQGALKALFPRSPLQDRALEATLINTSGGITGGDILNTSVTLSHTAKLTLSTQACERIYRASDGVPAQVITQLLCVVVTHVGILRKAFRNNCFQCQWHIRN